jgi:TolB protein
VRFAQDAAAPTAAFDFAEVIQQDLERSGRFRLLPRERMPADRRAPTPSSPRTWRAQRHRLRGGRAREQPAPAAPVLVEFELVNVLNGQRLLSTAAQRAPDGCAQRRAPRRRQAYTRRSSARAVRSRRASPMCRWTAQPPSQRYQLIVADADGENARVPRVAQPVMSPAWSPDGEWLAYVSFENRLLPCTCSACARGERRQVSARAASTARPPSRPDGRRLALTLSGSTGNLDIYVLELATQGADAHHR